MAGKRSLEGMTPSHLDQILKVTRQMLTDRDPHHNDYISSQHTIEYGPNLVTSKIDSIHHSLETPIKFVEVLGSETASHIMIAKSLSSPPPLPSIPRMFRGHVYWRTNSSVTLKHWKWGEIWVSGILEVKIRMLEGMGMGCGSDPLLYELKTLYKIIMYKLISYPRDCSCDHWKLWSFPFFFLTRCGEGALFLDTPTTPHEPPYSNVNRLHLIPYSQLVRN